MKVDSDTIERHLKLLRQLAELVVTEDVVEALRWAIGELSLDSSLDWMTCGKLGHRWQYRVHGNRCPACEVTRERLITAYNAGAAGEDFILSEAGGAKEWMGQRKVEVTDTDGKITFGPKRKSDAFGPCKPE